MNLQNMSQEEWKEAFINDTLSAQDRAFFQNLIDANPELKDEMQLEEGLRDAIFEARKKELKAHFNTLDVEPTGTLFNMPRTALVGSLLVASVMTSMLTYFDVYKEYHTFFKPKSYTEQVAQKNIPSQNTQNLENVNEQQNNAQNQNNETANDNVEIKIKLEVQNNNANLQNTNSKIDANAGIAMENTKKTSPNTTNVVENLEMEKSTLNRTQNQKLHTLLNVKPRNEQKPEEDKFEVANNLTYQTNKQDDDLGIFDGKRNTTLENDLKGNKLSYQYYGNKLFLYSNNVRGKELHLDEKTGKRHFLYYDKQFFEFFDNQIEKTELKPVTQPELIDRLKKELLNR